MKMQFTIILIVFCFYAKAQIGISASPGFTPNSKAILDISSTTKGVLLPRMSSNQRIAIAPTIDQIGLIVYDITTKSQWNWNGAEWKETAEGTVPNPLYLASTATTITGETNEQDEVGVLGINTSTELAIGMQGLATATAPTENSIGIWGQNRSQNDLGYGVFGTHEGTGWAGRFDGINALKATGATEINGNLTVSGEIKPGGITGQAGQVLTSNGNGGMSWANTIGSTIGFKKAKMFVHTGGIPVYNWTVPTGVTEVMVELLGPGGRKLNLIGGGSGAYGRTIQTVSPGTSLNINLGVPANEFGSSSSPASITFPSLGSITMQPGNIGGSITSATGSTNLDNAIILNGTFGSTEYSEFEQKNATTWTEKRYKAVGGVPPGLLYNYNIIRPYEYYENSVLINAYLGGAHGGGGFQGGHGASYNETQGDYGLAIVWWN